MGTEINTQPGPRHGKQINKYRFIMHQFQGRDKINKEWSWRTGQGCFGEFVEMIRIGNMCHNAPLVNGQITFRDSWNSTDSYFSLPELFLSRQISLASWDKNICTWARCWDPLKNQHNIHFGELSGNLTRSGKTPGAALPPSSPRSRVSANRTSEAQGVKWDHTFPGT